MATPQNPLNPDAPAGAITPIKIESPENAAAVARNEHYKVHDDEAIDWRFKLFDAEGYEHRLIDLGGVQVVTKTSFAYAIWDRKTGRCVSHEETGPISNTPMTDAERQRRRNVGLAVLRDLHSQVDVTKLPDIASIEALALHCSRSEVVPMTAKFVELVGMSPDRFCGEVDGGHSKMLEEKLEARFTGTLGIAMLTELKAFIVSSLGTVNDGNLTLDGVEAGGDPPVVEIQYTTEQRDRMAALFYDYLLRDVGVEKMEVIEQRNREEMDPSICHSHDFIDANVTMLEAFTDVMGFEPDLRSNSQTNLWNDAWSFAKSAMKETPSVLIASAFDGPEIETVYRVRIDFQYPLRRDDELADQYYGRKRQLESAIDGLVPEGAGMKSVVHIGVVKAPPYIEMEHSAKDVLYHVAKKAMAAIREHGGAVVYPEQAEPSNDQSPAP